jgi:hypothetical protein
MTSGRLKLIGANGDESFSDLEAGGEHDVINASDGDFSFVEIELKG